MSNTSRIIQIPVLFDMSGSSLVFGEEATGDFVDSHLQFLLDMTTEANGISLNASDISSSILIGDQDGGDNIFFDGDSKGIGIDNLCNRIAKAITRGKLVHVPSMGNFSNSGIPIGGEKHLYSLHGDKMPAGGYSKKYTTSIAPIGDEQMLGQAMARVASVHLIGDPLGSQAFEDAASIQTSLEIASGQTFNQGMTAFYNALAVQLSKVLGGSKSSAPMNPGILVGSEKYSHDYNLTATDQHYSNDGRTPGSSLTGQVYTASSVSSASYEAHEAFDTQPDTEYRSKTVFDGTTGLYTGETIISGIDGLTTNNNSWQGLWLKVDIGQTVVLSEYKIHPRHNTSTIKNTPREGYLISSIDGINWNEIHHLNLDDTTGRLLYHDGGNYGSADTDLTGLNNREGRYFAFVWKKVFTNSDQSYGGIGELQLLGVTKDEFDGGSPPAPYDVASSASTLSGQSYSSSHHYDASWKAHEAFDNTLSNSSAWLTPSGSFTQATGELITTYQSVTFNSGIPGEWIQVDLSQNINPGKFYLNAFKTSYPIEGYLVSSKDKITWHTVHVLDSNNWNTHSTDRIHYEVDISGTPTGEDDIKIGTSWRLIMTKLNTNNSGYIRLYDFNLHGIVFPTDFGSAPSTTNQIYILDKTPYDFTSKQTNARFMVPAITEQRYTSSSRWDNTTYTAEKAFLEDMQEHWRSSVLYRYHTTTGLHDFSTWTGPYRGEWIQVDLSENFVATSYLLEGYRTNNADNKNSPKKGYLLGSIDNKRWNLIHTLDLSSNDANEYYNATDGYKMIRIHTDKTSVCSARYFRFVIEKLFPGCDGYVALYNFRIYGVKESEATLGNGQSTTTFIDDYSLKVTPYNVSVHMPTTAIENVTISPPFTQNRYTASSTNSTSTSAWEAFTPVQSSYRWECEGGMYNGVQGTYYGATLTDIYPGEWVQVDLSENVFIDSYTIQGYLHNNDSYHNSSPKKGYLLSSLDGMKWRLAHTFEIQTDHADYIYDASGYGFLNNKITNNENAIGKSWRFVTEKLFAGNLGYVALQQFSLYGVKYPSEIIQGDITKTTQDNSIYTLDVTPYNLTSKSFNEYSHGSSLTGQTYSASSHHSLPTYEAEHAFESYHTNNWICYASKYNGGATADGDYYGTERTGDYKGEWIQVDLSENVFADSYTIAGYFYANQTYANSSPKKGYLLSSLDGKEWRLAHTFDVQTRHGDYAWTATDGYGCLNHKITNNKNAIGRYWRFVTEKVFQGNLGYVVIHSFNIYGGKYPSEVTNGNGGSNAQLKLYSTPTTAIDFTLGWEVSTSYSDELVPRNNINQTFTSSSYHSGYEPWEAFGRYIGGWYWRPYGSNYNGNTGTYYGSARTGDYKGEWLQVDLSENYFADNYVIQGYRHTNQTYANSSPKKGYLLSSLDGKEWRLAHTFDIQTTNGDYTYNTTDQFGYVTHDISNNDNACGRYWRFVTEKLFEGNLGYFVIGCFSINGAKQTDRIEGNVVIDNSHNDVIYTLNATPYDLFNNFSELSGQVYSASSHGTTDAGSGVATTFDGHSDGNKWYSMTQYNGTSGLYYGCEFTGPYHGEWIQVDLSENVFADSYIIQGYLHSNTAYKNSSPKKGYLLSSLDGKEWRLAHTFDVSTNEANYVYNLFDEYGYKTHDISNNENAIGRYWRFVTEKLYPGNNGYVKIGQFTVLGVKYPSEVTEGNGGLTTTFKNHIRTTATPYDLFNNFSELSGQVYTASSHGTTDVNYSVATVFDGFQDNNKWYSKSQYNGSSGLYYGGKYTGPYHGEWIQVDLSENVFASSYIIQGQLHSNQTYANSSPKKGYLLSSLDGKDWRLVHTFDIQTTNADYTYNATEYYRYKTYDISNNENAIGRYWRFVTEKIFPGNMGYVRLAQFTVLGVKYPSETIEGNLVTDASRNNPGYVLNATPYDLFNNFSELSGQVYSASSHGTTDVNYSVDKTFDGFSDSHKWYSQSQYNGSSGLYYGNKFTGPYHGEWIQVDLSENVFAGHYTIQGYLYAHQPYANSSPKKGYLLSSLDGKDWRLAHTFDVQTDNADYTWTSADGFGSITHDIPNNENAIGRYWRFVTEKIFENNSSYVRLAQFTVLGVKYPSEVTVSNISVDPSLNITKNLPADMNSIYDLTSVSSTLTQNRYTASSQSSANYPPAEAFDNVHAWENAWRSVSQYHTTTGNYYGTKFTGPYKGEWLQVDLSENVVIGEYKILAPYYNHAAYYNSCPQKSYLLSSLDGKKWNVVHIHDVISFSHSYGSYTGNVTYALNGGNCKGRYFRLVTEKLFPSNSGYSHICGLEIKGVKESENTIISQSLANSYNTFTNTTTPYNIATRDMRHTAEPYLISSEKTTLISLDVSSPASTLTGQNYTASLGTANKAFDNDDATHWDISGNFKYNIFETLRTNEPNFTGWTLDPTAGLLLSFSENVQSGTTVIDKNDFSMVDNTQPNSTILSTDISNGKVLINIAKSFTYNNSVTEYDLASSNSTLMSHVNVQNRETIYTASSYYNTSYYPYEAFDAYNTSNNDNCWISANSSYSNQVNTNNVITVVDGTDVIGEWLQVELPENVIVNTFKYVPRPTTLDSIQEAVLVVSKNGTTWTQIGSISRTLEQYSNTTEETYSATAHISGKYVRLIIVKNWTAVTATVGELTLLGQKQSEATPNIITSHNNLKLTYTKNASKDKNIIGATNNVAVNHFSAIGGTLLNRGLYFTDSLATNEPNFTSSQAVGGKLEYTFSENLQAGTGGLDITDFQLINNSGKVIDISNNGTSITGGKLLIGPYVKDFTYIGDPYDLAGENATHQNIGLRNYEQARFRSGWDDEHLYDDNEATQWLGYEADYVATHISYIPEINGIKPKNGFPQYNAHASLSTNMVATNNNSWNGDWLKVDMGETVVVSEIKIYPRPHTNRTGTAPKQGVVISSNDGANWDFVASFSGLGLADWYDGSNWLSKDITVTGSGFRTARWIAVVFEKDLRGVGTYGAYLAIGELEIYGVTKTEQDSGSPPTPYDLAAYSRAGVMDRRYYASGEYHTNNNWNINEAFNGWDSTTDRAWISVNGTHYDENGDYIGPSSIQSGVIKGDWVQVDMGMNSLLSSFTIAFHSEMETSAGRVVGSLDGESFTTIKEFKHVYETDPSYVTINIDNADRIEYRYYRLILENVYGYRRARIMKWILNGYTKTHYYVGETINDIDYSLIYNKNASSTKNIIGATNSVAVNNFRIDNDYLVSRGNKSNIGMYNAATTTTLADTSTYTGEWIQVDIGENVFLDSNVITIPTGYTQLTSYLLLSSLDGSSWTKLYEVTDSNETLTFQSKKGRYVRLAINKIGSDVGFPTLSEFKINGTIIKLEGQTYSASLDNSDANTVFNNSITTSWDTSSAYNYNGIDAAAANEATYSSVALHQDASGNNRIELTFSADLSSNDFKETDFTITETDFSADIPLLADISGGKLLLERQANIQGSIFYEDFDDQVILGEITTADIVQKGIVNGESYDFGATAKTFTLTNGASFHKWHAMGGSKICEINGKYYTSGYTMHIDEINLIDVSMNRITDGGRFTTASQNDNRGHAMFAYNNCLYMYGGGSAHTQLDKYDISTDTWTFNITTNGSSPTFANGGWAMNGPDKVIFHDGGATDELHLPSMTWTRLSNTHHSLTGTTWVPTFVYNNRFYTYGAGPLAYGRYYDLDYLDLANPSNGWTTVTIKDPNNLRAAQGSFFSGWPRNANGVAVKDGKMYYVGGYDQYFSWYDNIAHYIDLTNETVYEIRPGLNYDASVHGIRHTHYIIDNTLYLFGAGTGNTTSGGANGWNGAGKNELLKIDLTKTTPSDFGYRLQGEIGVSYAPLKWWRIVDQTFLALSFWYKHGTGSTIFDSYNSTDSNATYSGGDGQKDWLYKNANKLRLRTRSPANIERWYQNGVVCTTPPGSGSHGHGTDGHTTMTVGSWHHVYIEFKTANDRIQFFARKISAPDNGDDGSIDQVRFYDRAISEAHIIEMANGWSGMYPGASFDKTDYLIEYKKNSSSAHDIYDVNNTTVPINDFIIRNGSLISRGTNFGHYSGSTTTTLADNSTSTGEYIEVNIGQQTYIISYELHVPAPNTHLDNNVYPKSWILLGSTDGSTWTKIHEVTDYAGWTTNSAYGSGYKVNYMNEITNITAQYYRLIINKTYGKTGYTSVAELLINGVKHTSETVGITRTKTASLGTAANAFDSNISTDWNTSSSVTYGTLASTVTNEPIFSSGTINGSSQIELTFDTNIDISGTFNKSNLTVLNSSFAPQAYNASVDAGKLLLTYNAEQFPGLDTIFLETFDDQTTTDPLGAVGSIVAGGKDGLGYALKRTTTQTAAGGVVFEQTTIPENIKSMSFWAIVDETDTTTGSINSIMTLKGSSGGNWTTYMLRFVDNALGQGTSEQKHMVEKYYIDGVLCGGATLATSYDTDITEGGNPVTEDSFKGTWRHIYLEWQLPINDPNVTNSYVSKIFWLCNVDGGYGREGRIDDIRFYGQALTETQITTLATNNLVGTFSGSLTDYNIQYTKSNDGNLVNATHTSVGVNSFALIGGTITNRGDDGKGEYTGSTSTTLPDSSTYDGEWIQIDVGQTILMTDFSLVVPNKDAYTNPKSWKLLISQDNTNWIEALDVSGNTIWNSGFGSASSDYSGFQVGSGLVNNYIGRYFKVIVNSIIGPANQVKINEIVIKGVSHTLETQSVAGDQPILYTVTESSNTTSQNTVVTTTTHNTDDTTVTTVTETTVDISANTVTKTTTKKTTNTVVAPLTVPTVSASSNTSSNTDSTVTTTTHNTDDTTITTVTETTVDIATNTVTTTTTKTTVTTAISPVTLNTATPSSTTTVHSDTTALTTTYNNNDTSVRTVVNRTIDISANTDTTTNLNTVKTITVSGFGVVTTTGSSFNPNKIYDVSGVACPALKSIYEQLMKIPGRSQIMKSQDFSTSPMPSVETITGGFPFIAGDKLVMYIRPKIQFAQATFPEQFTSLIGFGGVTFGEPTTDTALASGGAITGQTYTESSKYSNTYAGSKLFDGSTTTFWITASDTYGSDGVATGGTTTIHAADGGGTYTGHYVQIEFANSVAIEDIKITPRNLGGGGAGEPKEFRILSSDDGSTFRVAYSVAEGDLNNDWSLWSTQTFHLSNLRDASSKGKYWRIAVGKITTGNKVQLAKVELIGNLSSTLIDNNIGSPITTGGGGGPDLASQIYHEDFQDQSYDGSVTGAPVVSVTGHTGQSTYVVETKISATERWVQTGFSTAKTFSFWHKYIAGGKTSGTYIFEKLINGGYTAIYWKESDGNFNFEGYNTTNSTFYLNGMAQTSGNIPHDATQWTHYCFTFDDTNATGKINWGHPGRGYEAQTVYHTHGYFDDVRIFNEVLTESQIADLAAGNNGNAGSDIILPSDVALINMDGTTHSRERGDIANIIDNDDATWSYTTISHTAASHAPFITKFSFPTQQVGKRLKGVLFKTSATDNHTLAGLKFGILNGTTYTSLNVKSGINLGTGSSLTTGTVTWNNDTNWHIESYGVDQNSKVDFNDYTIQSNDHLVVRWSAATTYQHFTLRYLKFLISEPPSSSETPITTTYPTSTLTNGYPTTGSILDISGLETNITKLSSTFPALFPGNTTGGNEAEAEKYGWVGSANADTLALETTDETDTRTMDLHIWKITITL